MIFIELPLLDLCWFYTTAQLIDAIAKSIACELSSLLSEIGFMVLFFTFPPVGMGKVWIAVLRPA
jgi:hypothetical protein